MGKSFLEQIMENVFDAEYKGRHGEKLIHRKLNIARLTGKRGKVLRNVYVPKGKRGTTEIDLLFITRKGIFVIESKNYSGWIFGDENGPFWTVMLPNRVKNKMYNPVKQNATHIKWLKRYLDMEIPCYSLIIFSERCTLKKIDVHCPDVYVFQRETTNAVIRKIWKTTENSLTSAEVKELYAKLKPLTQVDETVKQEHNERINRRYQKKDAAETVLAVNKQTLESEAAISEPEKVIVDSGTAILEPELPVLETAGPIPVKDPMQEVAELLLEVIESEQFIAEPESGYRITVTDGEPENISSYSENLRSGEENSQGESEKMLCPRCGAELVERVAKKGKRAGTAFYGCSRYPKCWYTKKIEDPASIE
ncbi:MAG: NERD domain-containing protein [Eubacteriaceae bacterium]|jgi:predicted RNA-binding Zn-ribbon protein involved in translation (DUF1610 family)